jgi:hypothetical protein
MGVNLRPRRKVIRMPEPLWAVVGPKKHHSAAAGLISLILSADQFCHLTKKHEN